MADWLVPCNVKYYDVEGSFVYIYVGKPYSAIRYKCKVMKAGKPSSTIDDKKFVIKGDPYINYGCYMELELVKKYDTEALDLSRLKELGLKSVQGPSKVTAELNEYLSRF